MIKVYYNEEDGVIVATRRDGIEPVGFDNLKKIEVEKFEHSASYLVIDGVLTIVKDPEEVEEPEESEAV